MGEIRVELPNGEVMTFPAGTPRLIWETQAKAAVERLKQSGQFQFQPGEAPEPPGRPEFRPGAGPEAFPLTEEGTTPRQLVGGLAGLAGMAMPGTGLLGAAARTGLSTLGSAAMSEDPLAGAKQGALWGAGGEAAAKAIPYIGSTLAMLGGGSIKHSLNPRSTGAFVRSAEENTLPILVGSGNVEKLKKFKAAAGKGVQRAEESVPGRASYPEAVDTAAMESTRRSGQAGNPPASIHEAAEFASSTKRAEAVYQLAKRGVPGFDDMPVELKSKILKRIESVWDAPDLPLPKTTGGLPARLGDVAGPRAKRSQLYPHERQDILDALDFSVRDMGEKSRGLKGPAEKVLLEKKMSGMNITPAEARKAQLNLDLSSELEKKIKEFDIKKVIPPARLKSADLHVIEEVNNKLRTDLSMALIRGAGSTLASLPFLGPLAPWMGIAGIAADPRLVSGLGFAAGRAARRVPAARNIAEASRKKEEKK